MANWQDIRAFEERIYDAVQDYLENPEAYTNTLLRVYLDRDEMEYRVDVIDDLNKGTEEDVFYTWDSLVREGESGLEPDIDSISDVANKFIFLD